jgi:hypothetical protein
MAIPFCQSDGRSMGQGKCRLAVIPEIEKIAEISLQTGEEHQRALRSAARQFTIGYGQPEGDFGNPLHFGSL